MRAVFDTNVLVAAFVTEGICSKILARGRKRQFFLIGCPAILQEFERVLRKKLSASRSEMQNALILVSEALHDMVQPSSFEQGICRDPTDDVILACALEGRADYLVTGDADLLEIKSFKGIRIVTPRDFEILFTD